MIRPVVACALLAALTGCTADSPPAADRPTPSSSSPSASDTPEPGTTTPSATPEVASFDRTAAMATVRELAALGPREATSDSYRRAADIVEGELTELGYDVSRQAFHVPKGVSWGVPVGAGDTTNVVARPPGLRREEPHVVVGAHLDTVPQAPGAEDNASGIAVLLELARLAQATTTRLPVVLVAFGAEEPRGSADDEHHFGSQTYVRRLGAAEAEALVAMVALDRVGAPGSVPVCTGGRSPGRVQRELLDAAERIDVPTRACENRTSDHWPFEKAGHVVARVGGNDSPGYHSAQDLPRTVSARQLARSGGVVWEWLRQS